MIIKPKPKLKNFTDTAIEQTKMCIAQHIHNAGRPPACVFLGRDIQAAIIKSLEETIVLYAPPEAVPKRIFGIALFDAEDGIIAVADDFVVLKRKEDETTDKNQTVEPSA